MNNFPVSDRQRLACLLHSSTLLQENGHDSNSLTARLFEASQWVISLTKYTFEHLNRALVDRIL